jgi:hypothetical protein
MSATGGEPGEAGDRETGRRVGIAGQRRRELRHALHDPCVLGEVGVVVEQPLPLARQHGLVLVGAGRTAGARVVRGLVQRVGAGAVRPVEDVERHHVAVEQLVALRVEEAGAGRQDVVVEEVVVEEKDRLVAVPVKTPRSPRSSRRGPGAC